MTRLRPNTGTRAAARAAFAAVLAVFSACAREQKSRDPSSLAPPRATIDAPVSAPVSSPSASAPEATVDWLLSQPDSPRLDAALAESVLRPEILVSYPAFAAAQAARISAPDLRRATLAEVYSTWMKIEPRAARRSLVIASVLPPIERAHLHELLAEDPGVP